MDCVVGVLVWVGVAQGCWARNTDRVSQSGHLVEVPGWDDHLDLGQVVAVDVNLDNDPVIFHRGSVTWNAFTYDRNNALNNKRAIEEDTILTLDAVTGAVKSSFGSGMFYMPHGLRIDHEGNTWVIDTGLHQVMKFSKGQTNPSLVLGEKFVPGNDARHFCKPTSVSVASSGTIFVADGYCNNRVAVFDKFGNHVRDIRGNWNVVHSIELYEKEDMLCIADREGQQVECLSAGIRSPKFLGQSLSSISNLGRVYAIAGRGDTLIAVNGQGFFKNPQGVSVDINNNNQIFDTWGDGLKNPHDVALDRLGDAVYVVEIGPNTIRKFEKSD